MQPWGPQRPPPPPGGQNPWATAPGPWVQVPRATHVGAAPVSGHTGQFPVWSGAWQQQAAHARWTGPQPGHWGAYPGAGQYPGYPQPAQAPRLPPPKKSSVAPVLLSVGAVLLVLFLLAGGCLAMVHRGLSRSSGPLTSLPSTGYGGTSNYRRTRTSSTERSPGPSETGSPLPTGAAALGGNPLYSNPNAGLIRQPCPATPWSNDPRGALAFFKSVLPCLESGWQPVLTATGLDYENPDVLVPSGARISSPCGTEDVADGNVAAFYCSSNETLYMPPTGLEVDRYGDQPIIYIAVFAHEFGHHLQNLVGMLDEEVAERQAAGSRSDASLELSRRLELQAQCFSGMFVSSIVDAGGAFTKTDLDTAYKDQHRGDHDPGGPRDHGTDAHSQGWWDQGARNNTVGTCNTWNASSADVS
ncbi:neutral zinc metallopeptidase [Mycolicibacterium sp. CBMA 234]|uniref:neutral zinc metallopeptidase n=1 Tax=Mycolicibacterium sp. CBMA 234 TaxID=1918495 RepID=UPI0012DE564A|nr:neutral zinc metallopeptidase [Mycolicibacterium sp. CBMA 234]